MGPLLSAFGAATGKDFSGSMMSASGGGVTSSGGLSGIWGIQPFSNHTITGGTIGAPAGAAMSMIGPNGQQGYGDANGKWLGTGNSSQTSIGQLGQIASIGAGGAMMLSGGISQIQGGGAKNITSGIGSIAGSIGGTAGALGSMGAFGGMFAVGGGSVATGALGLLGPIGVALGAVAMIASLFMQSKSSSTQTQTSETKVASKIDLSNQKLELINKNLLALNNTMSTYALATSAYFSEKNGTIDSQFALAGNRAY